MRSAIIAIALALPLLGFKPPEKPVNEDLSNREWYFFLKPVGIGLALATWGERRSGYEGDLSHYRGGYFNFALGAQSQNLRLYVNQQVICTHFRLKERDEPIHYIGHDSEQDHQDFTDTTKASNRGGSSVSRNRNLGATTLRAEGFLYRIITDQITIFGFMGLGFAYHYDQMAHPGFAFEWGLGLEFIDHLRLGTEFIYHRYNDDDPNSYNAIWGFQPLFLEGIFKF